MTTQKVITPMSIENVNSTERLIYNLLWEVAAAKGTGIRNYDHVAKGKTANARRTDNVVPGGRQRNSLSLSRRDRHVTGLSSADHRQARSEARQGLADPDPTTLKPCAPARDADTQTSTACANPDSEVV